MAFTKIVGAGIHTLSNVNTHNINSSGIITATQFVGIFTGTDGDFSGNVTIDGNLTVNGTTTTLDTTLQEVDQLFVSANNGTVGAAITQSGGGDILRLYDGSTQVLKVTDGGRIQVDTAIDQALILNSTDNGAVYTGLQRGGSRIGYYGYGGTGTNFKIANEIQDGDFQIQVNDGGDEFNAFAIDASEREIQLLHSSYRGKVGINRNPAYELDIESSNLDADASFRLYNSQTGGGNDTIHRFLVADNTASNYIYFGDADDTNIGQIRYDHNNDSLRITVNAQERIRIRDNGDVGIGTNNPIRRLHVADYGTHGVIRVEGSGNTNRSGIEFYRETSAGVSKGGAAIWVESDTTSSAGKLRFGTASNAGVQGHNTDMILDHQGRLGINSTSPANKLDIGLGAAWIYPDDDGTEAIALKLGKLRDYNTSFNDILVADNDNSTTPTYQVTNKINRYLANWHFDRSTSPGATRHNAFRLRSAMEGANLGNKFTIRDLHDIADSVVLWSNGDSFIGVTTDGTSRNLGIGTDSPQAKLDVTAGGVNNAAFFKTASDKALIEFENGAGSTYNTRIGSATLGAGNVGLMFETGTSGSRLQAMVIDRYGNVGINKTSPAYKLVINEENTVGTAHTIVGSSLNPMIYLDAGNEVDRSIIIKKHTTGNGDKIGGLVFVGSPDASNYSWAGIKAIQDTNSAAESLAFYTSTSNTSGANSDEVVRIKGSKVGIGTDDPSLNLHVMSTSSLVARFERDDGAWAKVDIKAGTTVGNSYLTFGDPDTAEAGYINYEHNNNSLRFATYNGSSAQERLLIDSSGNVNIGQQHSSNPFAYLRFGASQFGAADIRPTDEVSHKVGLAFYTDGTQGSINPVERLRINYSGLVGIGTTNPLQQLHISGSGGGQNTIRIDSDSTGISFHDHSEFIGYIGNESGKFFLNAGGSQDTLLLKTNGSNRIYIVSDGKVGINEANPQGHLHVENDNAHASTYYLNTDAGILIQNKNSNASAKTVLKLESPVGGGDCALVYGAGATDMIFADRQYERLRIKSDGDVGIGTNNPAVRFHVHGRNETIARFGNVATNEFECISIANNVHGYPAIVQESSGDTLDLRSLGSVQVTLDANNNDNNTKYFRISANGIGNTAAELFRVHEDGDVGIGTASPEEKLDVRGNIKVDSGPVLESSSSGGVLRITSASGYLEVGSKNSSYAHFGTNRPKYYFDKRIIVNEGIIGSYDEDLRFYTDITEERIRIHNDTGNVGINTTVAEGKFVIGGDGASAQIHLKRTNTNVTGAVGAINFTAADAHSVANIYALGDGNDEGAHLVFKTTSAAGENNPYGSSTLERLRITSTGVVQLNTTNNAHIRGGVYAKYTGASGDSSNINTASASKISWLQTNTEIFENGGFTNDATDVTVPFDGIYMVLFNGYTKSAVGNSASTQRTQQRVRFRVNGNDVETDRAAHNYTRGSSIHHESSINLTAYLNLSAGDTVAISSMQESTVSGTVVLVKNESSLTFHLVA